MKKTLSLILACLSVLTTTAQKMKVKPNVIIVLSDDQGYGDLSAHGNPILKTPALDKMYAESVRMSNFHSSPLCTPTRGQLMTGIDAMRNGASTVRFGCGNLLKMKKYGKSPAKSKIREP